MLYGFYAVCTHYMGLTFSFFNLHSNGEHIQSYNSGYNSYAGNPQG